MDHRDSNESSKQVPAVHCEVVQAIESSGTINVFVICLDRVGHEQNIIDRGFALQLACALKQARQKAVIGEIDLVVVCSAKKGSFLAGADLLTELKYVGAQGSQRSFEDCFKLSNVMCTLEALPVPTIAVLNGTALGGGLELSLACDYRIADETCSQIGLPEVKMGVLPGAGGCVRLPRLVGLKAALGILLTGSSVNANKALSMGLVDMIMTSTETTATHLGEDKYSYDYQWLTNILACIDRKTIGKKVIHVESQQKDLVAVDSIVISEDVSNEDELMTSLGNHWKDFEKKAVEKYPATRGRVRLTLSYLMNTIYYLLALVQLWRQVGSKIPAPYICLLTVFRCLYAGSWKEAMGLSSLGFSLLATTAESKGLMSLFLLTRKLKRLAVNFSLNEKEKPPVISKEITNILVLTSQRGLSFSSTFIQGLLYSGFEVRVVDVSEKLTKSKVENLVRTHFNYSLKRHHLSQEDVQQKLSRLSFSHGSDVSGLVFTGSPLFVADCSMNEEVAKEVVRSLKEQTPQVVCLSVVPNQLHDNETVLVNLGDPLRKNTLCVEITPAGNKVPDVHIRLAASLIVALGKIPVLTPPTPLPQASVYLTIAHWALAVSLTIELSPGGVMNEKKLDAILCSHFGYTKGPFATMREVDPAYITQLVSGSQFPSLPHFDQLKEFLISKKLPTRRLRKGSSRRPSTPDLVEFINICLGLAALYVGKLAPGISEAAIDVLAVSGLVHFPPTEGGPLNYLARLGQDEARRRFNESCSVMPTESVRAIVETYSNVLDRNGIHELFAKTELTPQSSEYQRQREKTLLLTSSELKEVGNTCGVQNREVFLLPVPCLVVMLVAAVVLATVCVFAVCSFVLGGQ